MAMPEEANDHELTGWIDARIAPVREGVYQRRAPAGRFSCWNGRAWNADADDPHAAALAVSPSLRQAVRWRGRTSPSSAPCATCRGHTVIDRGVDPETGSDRFDECPDC